MIKVVDSNYTENNRLSIIGKTYGDMYMTLQNIGPRLHVSARAVFRISG